MWLQQNWVNHQFPPNVLFILTFNRCNILFTWYIQKLDGVGPVDNRPSTDKLNRFVPPPKKKLLHVTRDMWHMTRDMWHGACDMLWWVNILSKFQLPSSYGLWYMIFWRSVGKGSLTDWLNHGGDCRTAPYTPGMLITWLTWYSHDGWNPKNLVENLKEVGIRFFSICMDSRK